MPNESNRERARRMFADPWGVCPECGMALEIVNQASRDAGRIHQQSSDLRCPNGCLGLRQETATGNQIRGGRGR